MLPVIKYSDMDDAIAPRQRHDLRPRRHRSGRPIGERAHAVASQIESGTVWINKHLDLAPNIPFGGAKQSGIGIEFAEEGLAEFTQLQVINGPGRPDRSDQRPRRNAAAAPPHRRSNERRPMFDAQCDLAALVYERDHEDPDAVLRGFAAHLNARGFRAVGMVQAGHCADASLSAVLVHNGEELPLAQDSEPPREAAASWTSASCSHAGPGSRARSEAGADLRDRQPFWQARARRQGACLMWSKGRSTQTFRW